MPATLKEEILMATDYGYDVYRRYISPDIRLGKNVLSPLRTERHPSFSIYSHRRKGDIWFKDFPEGGNEFHGDCFQFVQTLLRLSNFAEAVKAIKQEVMGIYSDDPKEFKSYVRKNYKPITARKQEKVIFYPDYRPWSPDDLKLWGRFLIDQETLEMFYVRPARGYEMLKGDKRTIIKEYPGDPIYIICFPSGRMKIYRPLSKNKAFKWVSNVIPEQDIFGLHLIDKKVRNLFIMAGNKDTMSFFATTGIPTIAFASESFHISVSNEMWLESLAENIHVFYDNDKTGLKWAEMLKAKHNYKTHGHLLQKYSLEGNPMEDYAQLVDQQKHNLVDFFGRLKYSMNASSKNLNHNIYFQ